MTDMQLVTAKSIGDYNRLMHSFNVKERQQAMSASEIVDRLNIAYFIGKSTVLALDASTQAINSNAVLLKQMLISL